MITDQNVDVLENAVPVGAETELSAPLERLPPGEPPFLAVCDGDRDPVTGRVRPGNRLAVGNRVGRKTAKFRARLFKSVTQRDFVEIVGQLVSEAKQGRPWAVKLALDYLCGGPEDVLQDRLLILERLILTQEI